jgi:hypothetical protein
VFFVIEIVVAIVIAVVLIKLASVLLRNFGIPLLIMCVIGYLLVANGYHLEGWTPVKDAPVVVMNNR